MKLNKLTTNKTYNKNFTAGKMSVLRGVKLSLEEETALGKIIRAGVIRIVRKALKKEVGDGADVLIHSKADFSAKDDTSVLSEVKTDDFTDNGTGIQPDPKADEYECEENVRYIFTPVAQKAVHRLVEASQALVSDCAQRFLHRGLLFDDLIQEGNIGLIKAAERFDPTEARFSTYAYWWIRATITRAIKNTGDTIRLPVYLIDAATKADNTEFTLATKLGRSPSKEELASAIGLDVEKLDKLRVLADATLKAPDSLDTPVNADDRTLAEVVPDTYFLTPYEHCERKDIKTSIRSAIDSLSSNHRNTLMQRFGLDGQEELTLDEIARQRDCTFQNVALTQRRALKAFDPDDLYEFRIFLTA